MLQIPHSVYSGCTFVSSSNAGKRYLPGDVLGSKQGQYWRGLHSGGHFYHFMGEAQKGEVPHPVRHAVLKQDGQTGQFGKAGVRQVQSCWDTAVMA